MSLQADWVCLMYHDVSAEHVGVTGGPAYFSVTKPVVVAMEITLKNEWRIASAKPVYVPFSHSTMVTSTTELPSTMMTALPSESLR